MADPVNSSSKKNTCADIISSNCMTWGGPAIPCIDICKGASVTDVIYALSQLVCGKSTGGGGITSPSTDSTCYALGWVDFSQQLAGSGIPFSGTYCSLSFLTSGQFRTESYTHANSGGNSSYRISKNGDVKLKGVLNVDFTATSSVGHIRVHLTTIPPTCNLKITEAQIVLAEVDLRMTANQDSLESVMSNFMKAYAILDPSGEISLLIAYAFVVQTSYRYSISLGGITFNVE